MTKVGSKRELSPLLLQIYLFVAGIAVLIYGTHRLLHETMLIPGSAFIDRIYAGQPLTDSDHSNFERSRSHALKFYTTPDAYWDLATSYLVQAQFSSSIETRQQYALLSIKAASKGFELDKLNSLAWLRLAIAYSLLQPKQFEAGLSAWRQSISTGRVDHVNIHQRIHLGIIFYAHMNTSDVQLLKEQLKIAFNFDKKNLRRYLAERNLLPWSVILSKDDAEMNKYFTKA